MRWVQDEAVRALGRVCWARKRERVNGKDPSWVGALSFRYI